MDYSDIPLEDCPDGSEADMLLFCLDRVHRQFAWKSGGLSADRLRQQHPPSALTIAGLIKHLAAVEATWTARAARQPLGPPWNDRSDDHPWVWESAVTDEPGELYTLWYDTISDCRRAWVGLVADGGLDVGVPWGDDYVVNRRRALLDILEENLLHTGQTSIIRESIDGLTGNDPP